MSHQYPQACDFCGVNQESNVRIVDQPTSEYLDDPRKASLPNTVLCYECAEEVSNYLNSRSKRSTEKEEGSTPFSEADSQALLDQIVENNSLVLQVGRATMGIRFINGEWRRAFFPPPGPAMVETLTREDVRDRILSAKQVTIKRFDRSAWKRPNNEIDYVLHKLFNP